MATGWDTGLTPPSKFQGCAVPVIYEWTIEVDNLSAEATTSNGPHKLTRSQGSGFL